jgi:DNA polymerase-3 subunit beta
LIDGQFSVYIRVIPDGNDLTLAMDPGLFANAVDRVSIVASQKTRAVKMAIHPDHVVLTASGSDAGEAREEFPVNFSGDQLEIGFNARYLLDIAGQIDGDQCQMKLNDPTSPAIIRDAGDMNGLFVLMPMRV